MREVGGKEKDTPTYPSLLWSVPPSLVLGRAPYHPHSTATESTDFRILFQVQL